MTDLTLIREYLAGSHDAFAQLVRRHADWIYSMARRRVRDAHLAEDVTQAVFVVLARKAHRLSSETVLPAWLFQVARLSVARALRDRTRRQRRDAIAAAAATVQGKVMHPSSDEERTGWHDVEPWLDESVARLRPAEREAVLLRFYQQKSFGEVGAAIGTTEEAARKRVTRAVARLREMLVARGAVVSSAAFPDILSTQTTSAAPPALATIAARVATEEAQHAVIQLAKGAIFMMAWQKARLAIVATIIVLACSALGVAMITRNTENSQAATTAPGQPPAAAMKVTQVTPIVAVRDIAVSVDYYVNTLGFDRLWEWGDPSEFAAVARDGCTLFLAQEDQARSGTHVYMTVSDVNALHAQIVARSGSASIEVAPTDRPWGMREMIVVDPDGNRVRIGTILNSAASPSTKEK